MRRFAPIGLAFVVLGCSSSDSANDSQNTGGSAGSRGGAASTGSAGKSASGRGGSAHAGSAGAHLGGAAGSGPGGASGKGGASSGGSSSSPQGGAAGASVQGGSDVGGSGAASPGGAPAVGGAGGSPIAPGSVTFSIDVSKGPQRQFQPPATPTKVSPLVYGINGFAAWNNTTQWGFARQGGDTFTDWNWTNNYSNSSSDYCFWEGQEDGGDALAGWITNADYSIPTAQAHGVPTLATVPILDFVAGTFTNNTGINGLCPGTPGCNGANGYAANTGNLTFATADPNSSAFVKNAPKKAGSLCTCDPTESCASGCKVSTTGAVYQDEFVNYLKFKYANGGAPIFFSLDNEPNFWPSDHPELWPATGTPGCGTDGTVTYDDIVDRNVTYATAIKGVWPEALVFGPVVAQDGIVYAHSYDDPNLPKIFTDYYLEKLAAASVSAGHLLVDAYDVHYYTVGQSPEVCLQTPRMFWDPNFTDLDAATTDSLDFGYSGADDFFDKSLYPRQMAPRLLGKIAEAFAGETAPGLSFSEYNAGCEDKIEGGVAEADLLGIFGREGVFAASAWPLDGSITDGSGALQSYLVAAFDLYRNYDGHGSVVGDLTVAAGTSDVKNTSVYAFAHSDDPNAVEVVVLNKTATPTTVTISIASSPGVTTAAAWVLNGSQIAVVAGEAPVVTCAVGSCAFDYVMPPTSASTLVLR